MDLATVITITTAIATPVGGLLGFLATRGVDAYLRVKKANAEEDHHGEQRIDENYRLVIAELKGHVEKLSADLQRSDQRFFEYVKTSHAEILEAVSRAAKLEGQLEEMRGMVDRHDRAQKEHVEKLKGELERLKIEKAKEVSNEA